MQQNWGGAPVSALRRGGEKSQDWLSRVRQARIRQVLHGFAGLSGICPGLSFDPQTKTCLTCESGHGAPGDGTGCFILTDQNFVANLSGAAGAGGCIGVVRVEDSSLDELAEFLCELFGRGALSAGSVVCVGSGSHLHRTGAMIYAQDWNRCNTKIMARFPGIRVCPLIEGDCKLGST